MYFALLVSQLPDLQQQAYAVQGVATAQPHHAPESLKATRDTERAPSLFRLTGALERQPHKTPKLKVF